LSVRILFFWQDFEQEATKATERGSARKFSVSSVAFCSFLSSSISLHLCLTRPLCDKNRFSWFFVFFVTRISVLLFGCGSPRQVFT
ncbi:MAG: hypothetical protein ABFD69_12925, partial [Candidatus Sumerlaeia bacterium]